MVGSHALGVASKLAIASSSSTGSSSIMSSRVTYEVALASHADIISPFNNSNDWSVLARSVDAFASLLFLTR